MRAADPSPLCPHHLRHHHHPSSSSSSAKEKGGAAGAPSPCTAPLMRTTGGRRRRETSALEERRRRTRRQRSQKRSLFSSLILERRSRFSFPVLTRTRGKRPQGGYAAASGPPLVFVVSPLPSFCVPKVSETGPGGDDLSGGGSHSVDEAEERKQTGSPRASTR